MQKCCSKCKILKDISLFSLRPRTKDGYNGRCKACILEYNKKYRQEYSEEQKIKTKEKVKEYALKNSEKTKQYRVEYRLKNKEAIKKYHRDLYLKNKEKRKKYNLDNRRKKNEYYRNYIPSLNAKIAKSLHTRILAAVRSVKAKKYTSSIKLTGCSIEFFIEYIQEKFTGNMSWDNYGKDGWHLDHIRPCSSFDLSNPEDQKLCFHYTNYQPLWATTEIAIKYGESPNYIGNLEKGYKQCEF